MEPTKIHDAFAVHMLTDQGKEKAKQLAAGFSGLVGLVQAMVPAMAKQNSETL